MPLRSAFPGDFPDPSRARSDGLVAVGGDLSVERLKLAYASGIFPWSVNPISWWSPNPRGIIELNRVHVSRSLDRSLRRGGFSVTSDREFEAVIRACAAAPRPGQRTWISPEFIQAYCDFHRAGFAHSIEVWKDQILVGGIYGVVVGACFAGESMFHRADDASKVGLVRLTEHLRSQGFCLFDTQMVTPVTQSLGAIEISRRDYLQRLSLARGQSVEFGRMG